MDAMITAREIIPSLCAFALNCFLSIRKVISAVKAAM